MVTSQRTPGKRQRTLAWMKTAWKDTNPRYPYSAAGAKPRMNTGRKATARVTTTSSGWMREPASQSIARLEWWMAWKLHNQGSWWNARWIQ